MRNLAVILILSLSANLLRAKGDTLKLEGFINGAVCAAEGEKCDPSHVEKGELPVFQTEKGDFYFLANVPSYLLSIKFLKKASIKAKEIGKGVLYVYEMKIGKRKVFSEGLLIDPMGHKVSPDKAVKYKGDLYCPECIKMMKGK